MLWIEARIMVPTKRPEESTIVLTQEEYATRGVSIEEDIVKAFGGFTMTPGFGAWNHKGELTEEPVQVYTAGYERTTANLKKLNFIRERIFSELDQETVYISETVIVRPPVILRGA